MTVRETSQWPPAPWRQRGSSHIIDAADRTPVCRVYVEGGQATIDLIVSAPELYEEIAALQDENEGLRAEAANAEIAKLKDEIENLQADAGNDGSYIAAMRAAQTQICEAIGVERGTDNWPEFIARVRKRMETPR